MHHTVPENSLASLRSAVAAGAASVELDVRRTRDGVLVVHHDPRVKGRDGDRRRLRDLTYAELQAVASEQQVPTLGELAAEAARLGVRLVVELKESGYEAEVIRTVEQHLAPDRYTMMSFRPDAIAAVEALRPDIVSGLLQYRVPGISALTDLLAGHALVRSARRVGADFVAINGASIGRMLIANLASAGIPLDVWTVDGEAQIRKFMGLPGIRNVITNDADVAVRLERTNLVQPTAG